VAKVVECLPSKGKALSAISSTVNKTRQKQKQKPHQNSKNKKCKQRYTQFKNKRMEKDIPSK
jgi:hypothetical protein